MRKAYRIIDDEPIGIIVTEPTDPDLPQVREFFEVEEFDVEEYTLMYLDEARLTGDQIAYSIHDKTVSLHDKWVIGCEPEDDDIWSSAEDFLATREEDEIN